MRRFGRTAGLLLALLVSGGCTSSAMLAPSTIPLDKGYVKKSEERVSARRTGFMVLFIPFGQRDPAGRALQDCLAENSADALIEVSVHVSQFSMIAFTIVWTTVAGIPVRAK